MRPPSWSERDYQATGQRHSKYLASQELHELCDHLHGQNATVKRRTSSWTDTQCAVRQASLSCLDCTFENATLEILSLTLSESTLSERALSASVEDNRFLSNSICPLGERQRRISCSMRRPTRSSCFPQDKARSNTTYNMQFNLFD